MTLPAFQVEALKARLDIVLNNDSDIIEHLPTFMDTVRELDAKKVIEVGVRYGVSTIAWLYALQPGVGTGGFLWAVDVSFPTVEPTMGVDLLNSQAGLTVLPHWMFICGDGHSQRVLDALPNEVDILFLDMNHIFQETLNELEMYYPKVRKGGRILLHDSAIEDTPNRGDREKVPFPVLTAVAEFCDEHDFEWTNVEHCNGLATIYL